MAENKEYLMKTVENGSIYLSEEVICTIAAVAAMDVDGVEAINNNIGTELAGKLGVRNIAKAIKLTVDGDAVSFGCNVTISYGYDVVEVAKELQNAVSSAVSSMTGFRVERVDVSVDSIGMGKKNKA